MEKKIWLEYIIKVNDRQLNKKRASGMTIWSLGGLLIVLTYNLLENLPFIFQDTNNQYTFVIFSCCLINLWLTIAYVYLIPVILSFKFKLKKVPLRVALAVLVVLNFYCGNHAGYLQLSEWPFYAIGSFVAVQVIGDWALNQGELSVSKITTRLTFTIGVLVGATLIYLLSGFSTEMILADMNILKLAIEFIGLILVVSVLFKSYSINAKYKWLETLERAIMLEDLSEREIKKRFVKEFLGEELARWVDGCQQDIDKRYQNLRRMVSETESSFRNKNAGMRSNSDAAQMERMFKDIKEYNQRYVEYSEDILNKVTAFDKSQLTPDEKLALIVITRDWEEQLHHATDRVDNLLSKFNSNQE